MKGLEKCYINFFGSGNPNKKYWFIGFEPGGDPFEETYYKHVQYDSEQDFLIYAQDYCNEKVERGLLTQLITLLDKLALKTCFEVKTKERRIQFNNDCDAFYTNLFLLKFPEENDKRNSELLKMYKKYFNIPTESEKREDIYPLPLISQRYSLFSKYLKSSKTIFILKKSWNTYYYKLLGLKEIKEIDFPYDEYNIDKNDIYLCDKHIVVFMKNGRFSYDGLSQTLGKVNLLLDKKNY